MGRPTLDKSYCDHLHALISSNSLPEGASPVCPPWWRPGMDIIVKPDKIIEEVAVFFCSFRRSLASALVRGDTEAAEDVQVKPENVPDEVVDEQPSKRKKNTITSEARDWFLQFHACKRKQCGWTRQHSVQETQKLRSELFSGVHRDTVYKWKPAAGAGVKLIPGECTILFELLQEVTAGVPLQAPAITELINNRLADTKTVSASFVRGFMKELGYTHKKIVFQSSLDFDPATALTSQRTWY
eukprot:2140651-Amphidinium_carterae.1